MAAEIDRLAEAEKEKRRLGESGDASSTPRVPGSSPGPSGGASDSNGASGGDPAAAAAAHEGGTPPPASPAAPPPLPLWQATLLQLAGLCFARLGAWGSAIAPLFFVLAVLTFTPLPEAAVLALVPCALCATHLLLLLFGVASKWALLGRQREGAARVWGARFVAWWTVRAVQHHVNSHALSLLAGSQLHNWRAPPPPAFDTPPGTGAHRSLRRQGASTVLPCFTHRRRRRRRRYLRALGAKIGNGVVIDTLEVSDWRVRGVPLPRPLCGRPAARPLQQPWVSRA